MVSSAMRQALAGLILAAACGQVSSKIAFSNVGPAKVVASIQQPQPSVGPFGVSSGPSKEVPYDARTTSDFTTRDSRLGFIRKVYSIFSAQMLTTIVVTAAIMQNDRLRYFLYSNWPVVGSVAALGSMSSALLLVLSKRLRQTPPLNFLLLGVYTLLQSVLVGVFSSLFDPRIVSLGTMHTLTAFVSLTAWTFLNPQHDLSVLGNTLLALSCTGSLGLILGHWFNMPLLDNLGSIVMAVVMSVYVAHDTALIAGGKHRKRQYGPKEYILACLNLYQDVIALFMRIVEFLHKMDEREKNRFSRF